MNAYNNIYSSLNVSHMKHHLHYNMYIYKKSTNTTYHGK